MKGKLQEGADTQPTVAVAGDGYALKVVKRNFTDDIKNKKNCLVKINDNWFDIADYMDQHPGGDIIKEFIGKDCTVFFRLWHPTHVFKNPQLYAKPVREEDIIFLDECDNHDNNGNNHCDVSSTRGSEDGSETPSDTQNQQKYVLPTRPKALTDADLDYLKVYQQAENSGYFKGSTRYLIERFAIIIFFVLSSFAFLHGKTPLGHSIYAHFIGAFCLFWVWHQNAGIMHDSGHNQYFNGNIKKNARLMFLSANIGGGLSSNFWKWEHIEHHTFTQCVDEKLGNCDPQNTEEVWYQDAQLVDHAPQNYFSWFILRIQAFLAPIAITLAARIGIVVDGFVTETRWWEFAGLAMHLSWISWLLSDVYTNFGLKYALFVYYMAALCFSILAFQLQSNHMDKPWIRKHEEHDKKADNCRPESHIHKHIRACTNIRTPSWLDWAWGGLHFHMEHHCFPRMGREHYRAFSKVWKEFCERHDYQYHIQGCFETFSNTVHKLNEVRSIRDIFDLGREEEMQQVQKNNKSDHAKKQE